MSKKSFLLGAIASIIVINSVVADTVVTSRGYVDAADALKQDKITAGTTGNVVTYNGTQNGQAQFSERAIFDPETNFDYENNEVATGHEGDLVTAESIFPAVNGLYQSQTGPANTVVMYNGLGQLGGPGGSRGIYDGSNGYDSSTDADKLVTASVVYGQMNNIQSERVVKTVCVDSPDCTLWQMQDVAVHKLECSVAEDCINKKCPGSSGGIAVRLYDCNACVNYKCAYQSGAVY